MNSPVVSGGTVSAVGEYVISKVCVVSIVFEIEDVFEVSLIGITGVDSS